MLQLNSREMNGFDQNSESWKSTRKCGDVCVFTEVEKMKTGKGFLLLLRVFIQINFKSCQATTGTSQLVIHYNWSFLWALASPTEQHNASHHCSRALCEVWGISAQTGSFAVWWRHYAALPLSCGALMGETLAMRPRRKRWASPKSQSCSLVRAPYYSHGQPQVPGIPNKKKADMLSGKITGISDERAVAKWASAWKPDWPSSQTW